MAQVQPQNKEGLPITVTFLNLLTFLLKKKKKNHQTRCFKELITLIQCLIYRSSVRYSQKIRKPYLLVTSLNLLTFLLKSKKITKLHVSKNE